MLFKNYPEGSDLTILSTMYQRPTLINASYDSSGNIKKKYGPDLLTVVARDNTTGEKLVDQIENPEYTYYKLKDGVNVSNNLFCVKKEDVEPITTKYKDVLKSIAENTGNLDWFYDNIKTGNRKENNKLHLIKEILNSDMDIEDYYRMQFSKTYTNAPYALSKAYFDIEVRTKHMAGDFPEPGECPIDAITLILEKERKIFTFLLRDKENIEQIAQLEKEYASGELTKEFHDFAIDAVGGWKQATRVGYIRDNMVPELYMIFYDEEDEIKLIKDFFVIMNYYKPDFAMAWNMAFDIPYIICRLSNISQMPEEEVVNTICSEDFKEKKCYYFVDDIDRATQKRKEIEERNDRFDVSSYTVYVDQMIQFASRRKGQSKFPNYKLDTIGEIVAGVNKLDYHDICSSITELSYKSYKTYVFYNIMDVIVQLSIEYKSNDIDYIFAKSLENNTPYSKIHRQTVYLTNRGTIEFDRFGYIIGNNANKYNKKPDEKFPGAYVADPLKITDYSKLRINDTPVSVYDNLVDFDFTRLYPSVIQENNMAPNTQIGKILIDNPVHDLDNRFNRDRYNRGGQFIEDYQSGCYLEFCSRWLALASFSELIDDLKEYNWQVLYNGYVDRTKGTNPGIIFTNKVNPIKTFKDGELINPIVFDHTVTAEMKEKFKNE
jgi:DNA polymerase elongation subunit (family B)